MYVSLTDLVGIVYTFLLWSISIRCDLLAILSVQLGVQIHSHGCANYHHHLLCPLSEMKESKNKWATEWMESRFAIVHPGLGPSVLCRRMRGRVWAPWQDAWWLLREPRFSVVQVVWPGSVFPSFHHAPAAMHSCTMLFCERDCTVLSFLVMERKCLFSVDLSYWIPIREDPFCLPWSSQLLV